MRESGEYLQIFCLQQGRKYQFVSTGIEHLNITELVIYLNTLSCASKETLMHRVNSHCHIVALWVPVTVRASRLGRIGLGFYPSLLTIFLYHGTPTLATHLQGNTVGIGTVGCMTIKASAWHNGLCKDGSLIKITEITLVDADIAPHLVAWFYTAIGQSPFVQIIFAYIDIKVIILCPLAVFLHTNREGDFSTSVLLG